MTIAVFDVLGMKVATLVDMDQQPGRYSTTFNADHLSTGVYLYRIVAGDFISTRKLSVVK